MTDSTMLTPDGIEQLFTRSDGSYAFARWGRPIVPVVFGVEDETIGILKGAIEAVVAMAGHKMAETDPELGANLMFFFFREWEELLDVPDLDRLVHDLAPLVARLKDAGANQYRVFRFEADGGVRASFVFLRMDADLADVPADSLALSQVAQTILLWSNEAFRDRSVLGLLENGTTVLHPEVGAVIRAAYDPMMPVAASEPSHALRLFARLQIAPDA